jgi:hypothetical protein
MKKTPSILMALLLPTLSFCQQFTPVGHYNISLKAKGVKSGTKIYLFYQTEGKKIVDSAMSDNGLFHLAGEAAKPLPATLVLDSGNENIAAKTLTFSIRWFEFSPIGASW